VVTVNTCIPTQGVDIILNVVGGGGLVRGFMHILSIPLHDSILP